MYSYVSTAEIYCSDLNHSKEIELTVAYDYRPACKGARGEHGEPLEPDTDEEFEVTSIAPNNLKPDNIEILVASYFDQLDDYDQLIDAIKNEDVS
jgi:hypothetical protein